MNDGTRLVLLRSFTSPIEAELARAVLDAASVPVVIADEHIVHADWFYSNAVGGVKVLVPADQVDTALALLEAARPDRITPVAPTDITPVTPADANGADTCPECGTDLEPLGRRFSLPIQSAYACPACGTVAELRPDGLRGIASRLGMMANAIGVVLAAAAAIALLLMPADASYGFGRRGNLAAAAVMALVLLIAWWDRKADGRRAGSDRP